MDEVKKKVLLDLFVSPWTVVPLVTGMSAWLLSWGVGGNPTLNLIGLGGVLISAGIQASRLVFGVEKLTEQAHGYLAEKQEAELEQRLDELAAKLRKDREPRTQECLLRLRKLRALFNEESVDGHAAVAIKAKVEKLFDASVRQLEKSYRLWEKAKRLPTGTRQPLLDERKSAVDEVVLTVNQLTRTVKQFHEFQLKESDDELAKLREELNATIDAARKADELIDSLDESPDYDPSEFEQVDNANPQ